jgi:hypothetical protein
MSGNAAGKWLLGVASIVMIGAVVAGLGAVGTPAHQRALRLDQVRVQDLSAIARGIQNHWAQHHELPLDLSDYEVNNGHGVDKATGTPYVYSLLNVKSYSLCATFDASSDAVAERRSNPYSYVPDAPQWKHPAGRHCFAFLVDHGSSPVN